ncbi:hypothetical protein PROFUN_13416 [Planoprotostelium fungivorum]|uniref:Uncharacterized protein n=1 Tax=Planoprotostelium fungivorum TaxID=1890364 RepID=A0A2P6N3S1_9EUKA|nr:hypothetical protein PROFUN_13416 [Planoprotostelium fungivorum]
MISIEAWNRKQVLAQSQNSHHNHNLEDLSTNHPPHNNTPHHLTNPGHQNPPQDPWGRLLL